MAWWLVVLLVALPKEPESLTVVVTSANRLGYSPAHFKPVGRIYDPKQELDCASFRWEWEEGASGGDLHCAEEPSQRKTLHIVEFNPRKWLVIKYAGEQLIYLIVKDRQGKVLLRGSVTVVVLARGE